MPPIWVDSDGSAPLGIAVRPKLGGSEPLQWVFLI
jgi:hypothetical protein